MAKKEKTSIIAIITIISVIVIGALGYYIFSIKGNYIENEKLEMRNGEGNNKLEMRNNKGEETIEAKAEEENVENVEPVITEYEHNHEECPLKDDPNHECEHDKEENIKNEKEAIVEDEVVIEEVVKENEGGNLMVVTEEEVVVEEEKEDIKNEKEDKNGEEKLGKLLEGLVK